MERMNTNGVGIVPRRRYGDGSFAARFRAVDAKYATELSQRLPPGTPLATAGEMPISYCPSCGANLLKWIAEHPEDFEVLLGRVIE